MTFVTAARWSFYPDVCRRPGRFGAAQQVDRLTAGESSATVYGMKYLTSRDAAPQPDVSTAIVQQ